MVENQTIKTWLTEYLDERIGEVEVDAPETANLCADFFLQNPEVTRRIAREAIRGYAYSFTTNYLSATHDDSEGAGPDAFLVAQGSKSIPKKRLEHKAAMFDKQFRPEYVRWMEHNGNRYVPFLKMTRDEMVVAAQQRERRTETGLRRGIFLRLVIRDLRKGSDTAGEVMTNERLDELQAKARKTANDQMNGLGETA